MGGCLNAHFMASSIAPIVHACTHTHTRLSQRQVYAASKFETVYTRMMALNNIAPGLGAPPTSAC
eukprot:scaffold261444_cov22-Tisochrysis_lutea.AAC.2